MQMFHQNMSPPPPPPPDTIFQGHRCCILGLAPPKTMVIGLKKYKQDSIFSPYTRVKVIRARPFSSAGTALKPIVEIGLAMRD